MIWIMRVGRVMCSRCGNHLEGVEAVFAGNAEMVPLCWQDFEARAMKRRSRLPCCLDDPNVKSVSCDCPARAPQSICESNGSTRGTSTTHARSETETYGGSPGDARTPRGRTENYG